MAFLQRSGLRLRTELPGALCKYSLAGTSVCSCSFKSPTGDFGPPGAVAQGPMKGDGRVHVGETKSCPSVWCADAFNCWLSTRGRWLRNSRISVCLCQDFWELVGPELWPAIGVHDEVTEFGMKGTVGKR